MTSHPNWAAGFAVGNPNQPPQKVETWPNVWAELEPERFDTTAILRLKKAVKNRLEVSGIQIFREVSEGFWGFGFECLVLENLHKKCSTYAGVRMSKEIRGSGESGRWECKRPQVPKSRTAGCWQCLDIICFNVPLIQIRVDVQIKKEEQRCSPFKGTGRIANKCQQHVLVIF